jgi:hypothetical protein
MQEGVKKLNEKELTLFSNLQPIVFDQILILALLDLG